MDMTCYQSHTLKTRSALLASFWFCLVVLFALSGCAERQSLQVERFSGATMGTTYHITVVSQSKLQNAQKLQEQVDALLEQLNQEVSTYIPDSEINRLKSLPVNQWVPVSDSLYQLTEISSEVSDWSEGAFDVTLRPLIDLWGFGPTPATDQVPDEALLQKALTSVGYQAIQLQQVPQALRRERAVDMDFSAVAKGYGVDLVAELLEQKGLNNYLVEIGGEIRLRGINPKGNRWRIAVETPQSGPGQQVYKALALTDMAMATSGDYRNYFEQNGKRYSHTLDPRTGRPITHNLASVTVLHRSAAMADALATAFNVMGVEQARLLANSKDIPALFIIKQGEGFTEISSDAFKPYLKALQ